MLRPQCGLLLALSMSSACDAKLGAADPAGPASALSARPPLDDESTAPRHPKPEPVEPSASARMGEEGRLPTSDRAPTEAAAPAQGVLVAELDEGCKLLGADDRYIYLSPGIFGSRRVVRVGIDGTIDHVQLDEPLAALDEAGAAWLTDFLRALKRAGKTVLFSTHDTALADALAGVRWRFTPAREVRVER